MKGTRIKNRNLLAAFLSATATVANGQAIDEKTNFRAAPFQIETVCNADNLCTVYGVADSWRKTIVEFPFPPPAVSYRDNTLILLVPCGSGCSATYFHSKKKGFDAPSPMVMSYDLEKEILLTGSTYPLRLYRMFDPKQLQPIGRVALNLDSGMLQVAEEISGLELVDHAFVISYTDKDGKKAVILKPVPSRSQTDHVSHSIDE